MGAMPLVKVFATKAIGFQRLPIRPLYTRLCTLFKVPEKSGVMQVKYVVAEEMHPDQLVFDIRAKGKADRTPEAMNEACKGLEAFTMEQGITEVPRVRIEL